MLPASNNLDKHYLEAEINRFLRIQISTPVKSAVSILKRNAVWVFWLDVMALGCFEPLGNLADEREAARQAGAEAKVTGTAYAIDLS